MSLLHRVSSTESFSRRPSTANASASSPDNHARRLSFNPVGQWIPPEASEEPIGAYEVPKGRRIAQVAAAVVYCLFAAGIVFGYAAIKPVLISEGVNRNYCTKEELEKGVDVCYDQELRLNFMFTIAAVATNVGALPIGTILDRYGPRVCGIISSVLVAMGCLLFAFAGDMHGFDGYIAGYFCLALGGPFVFISSFQLSNTFPRQSGLILALLTGAFDTSSAIFLIYRLIYTASGNTFRPKKFFLIYLVVPAFILGVQVFLMPSKSYKSVSELVKKAEDASNDVHDSDDEIENQAEIARIRDSRRERRESVISEITILLGSKDAADKSQKEDKVETVSGVYGALHGRTAMQQILTPWFVLVTLFTVLQMCRINYFVATIRPQYAYLLNSKDRAVEINNFFDFALPLGGVISVPFIGLVLDSTSTPFVLGLLVFIATAIGVLGVIPEMWAGYANVCLFVVYRPLYYTAISDYAAKVFGFETFGKVYGLIICLAGLFNFMQSALDALTHKTFDNNPIPVNLILLGSTLAVGIVLVGYVWYQSRSMDRARLEGEAEGARVNLMPGADERVNEDHHPIDVHGYGSTSGNGSGDASGAKRGKE